jgi:hypothetical protein
MSQPPSGGGERPKNATLRAKDLFAIAAVTVLAFSAAWVFSRAGQPSPRGSSDSRRTANASGREPLSTIRPAVVLPSSLSPIDLKEQEILKRDAGMIGDADLVGKYAAMNAKYFASTLPTLPVLWEPALDDVGPLMAEGFSLEGFTDGHVILLNPRFKSDPRQLDRVLCHEMVHAYLFSIGDAANTAHGPAFQQTLRRLSEEGAFDGIPATRDEKEQLRSAIDREASRLDGERQAVGDESAAIEQERPGVREAINDVNARVEKANREQAGWPSAAEHDTVKRRSDAFNQRVIEYNARVKRLNDDIAAFNVESNRYNLMMAYPDGLDEETHVEHQSAVSPASPD